MPNNMPNKKPETKLLGKGTYGCVYTPPLFDNTHKGKINNTQVSKIQENNAETKNEVEIGKKVAAIPNYSFFFGPLLDSHQINISQINDNDLEQCDVVQNNLQKEFVSNTMDYIGNETLADYFNKSLIETKNNPSKMKTFITKLISIHLYLLESVHLLNKNGIIHNDIKSNNIMYHESNKVFVLIDFGLSVKSENLDFTNYKTNKNKPFGIVAKCYKPWCMDIQILTFVARIVQPLNNEKTGYAPINEAKWEEKINRSDAIEMKRLVKDFLENNTLFSSKKLFPTKDLTEFSSKYNAMISSWESEKKTWKDIWIQLQARKNTWDAYSINAMMLTFMENTNMVSFLDYKTKELPTKPKKVQEQLQDTIKMTFTGSSNDLQTVHFFKQYILWLKESIVAIPSERPTSLKCKETITTLFRRITKSSFKQLEEFMYNTITTPTNVEKSIKAQEKNKLAEIINEKNLRKQHP